MSSAPLDRQATEPTPLTPLLPRGREPFARLPAPLTPLLGRSGESAAVVASLRRPEVRLLTLTGAGGTGKTRLALHVASELEDVFADGAVFVPLAPVTDPDLVVPTIARALNVREAADVPIADALAAFLRDRHLLLVLDNFEQILAAAPAVADLLTTAPDAKTLVTSRAPLHVRGEHRFPVPPLPLPDATHQPTPDTLIDSAAVALFLQRAQQARPDFALTGENAPILAAICRRLDGLPLAIELAAARLSVLPPSNLLARLEKRLPLLTGGPRDLPERLRTMRDAIAWSHDLLDPPEQALFRQLAVFAGGWDWEAAHAVARVDDLGIDVLDGLASLTEKNLIHQMADATSPRFAMLETIREFGLERLEASGEAEELRRRHAAWCLALAEAEQNDAADPGARSTLWHDRLEANLDNLRAALGWARDRGDAELGLRFGGALWLFWWLRGYGAEGGAWLEEALARDAGAPPAVRAAAIHGAGNLARYRGDYPRAVAWHTEDLALRRRLGDSRGTALALLCLGLEAFEQGDLAPAVPLLEESLPIFEAVGDAWGAGHQRAILGGIASLRGDYEQAAVLLREAARLMRVAGDTGEAAGALANLAWVTELRDDFDGASALYDEALTEHRRVGDKGNTAYTLVSIALLALRRGDPDRADALLGEAQGLARGIESTSVAAAALVGRGRVAQHRGDHRGAFGLYQEALAVFDSKLNATECLERLAGALVAVGAAEPAARLAAAADATRSATGEVLPPHDRLDHERTVAAARRALGEAAFVDAWTAGQHLGLEHAIVEALAVALPDPVDLRAATPPLAAAPAPETDGRDDLSPRELDVLRLIVDGRRDREIAEELFISRRTVSTHVTGILNKLGVPSRSAAVAQAMRRGLA